MNQRLARVIANRSDQWLERWPGPVFRETLPLSLRMQYQGTKAVTLDGNPLKANIGVTVSSSLGRLDYPLDIQIEGRRCRIRHRQPRGPDSTMRVSLANMIRMASGAAESSILMSQGSIEVSGDAFLLARFPALFGLPTRPVLLGTPSAQHSSANAAKE
jgi:hypothetical protein